MRKETVELIQRLILSGMNNIEAWEKWADVVPVGAAAKMHQSLIRLGKGMIKAVRLFLIEQRQIELSVSSLPVQPPSASREEASNGIDRQTVFLQRSDQG